jgi:uncharacterized protein (TIGR02265 family)
MTSSLVFENLFLRALDVQGPLREALLREGFDPADVKEAYPLRVLNACVDLASGHLWPGRPLEEGRRELGRLFVQGWKQTVLGKVVTFAVGLLGPTRYLNLFPEHLKMDTLRIHAVSIPVGARAVRVEVHDNPGNTPHFMAGMLEEGLRMTRVEPVIDVEVLAPRSFNLHVRW